MPTWTNFNHHYSHHFSPTTSTVGCGLPQLQVRSRVLFYTVLSEIELTFLHYTYIIGNISTQTSYCLLEYIRIRVT